MKQFLLLYFLFTLTIFTTAQDYTVQVKHFGVKDGLLHRDVSTVFEDSDHLIWIGSPKGLQRYDGYEFKSWASANTNGKINEIIAIGQDQKGWLWLWDKQLNTFVFLHPKTEKVLSVEERFGQDFPIQRHSNETGWNSPWRQLQTDSKGRFIFSSSKPNELIFFDTKLGFQHVPIPGVKSDFIELYFIDSQDHLWITERFTGSILHKVDTLGRILASYDYSQSFDIYNFSERDGKIYYTVDQRTADQYFEVGMDGVPRMVIEKSKQLRWSRYVRPSTWDCDVNGWNVFAENSEQPLFTLNRNDYDRSLFDFLNSFYEDSRGRIWIASAFGLNMILPRPNRFRNYFSFDDNQVKPLNNSARGILVEKDIIFANFEFGGLLRFLKDQPDQWQVIDREPSFAAYFGRPVIRLSNGEIFTGHPNELRRIIPQTQGKQKLSFSDPQEKLVIENNIWSFYQDAQNTLWLGMTNGLAYKKPEEDFLRKVVDKQGRFNPHADRTGRADIYHISPTTNGQWWLCGEEGLYLFDPSTQTYLARYGSDQAAPFYLPAKSFYALHVDSDGLLWLGTNEGLLRWSPSTGAHKLFTLIDGLSNDVIYAVYEDAYQHLWLSSDYGIMQFDKATFQVKSFLPKDGIPHEEFNRTAHFQEADGTIYFGGMNGITAFHPKDFHKAPSEKPFNILITGFEIYDGTTNQVLDKVSELQQTQEIIYRPQDRFFRLKFTLPTLEWNEQTLYAWKIEGVDDDWHYQTENVLQIGKLPYGNHLLRVKGRSTYGKWSPNELAIKVKVLKPIYLQGWFLGLCLLALIGWIFLWHSWRTYDYKQTRLILEKEVNKATTQIESDKKTIELQAEELRQLDKVKSRFFANVAHELRTPLTLMMGPISSVLKNNQLGSQQVELLKKAKEGGKELLKLIGAILDLSKMESGKMELHEQAELLFPLVRNIITSFESHAQQEDIRFTFIFQAEKSLCLELDRDKMEVILNNLLSNAMKFTTQGDSVTLAVKDIGHSIQFMVKDTGRGIHLEDQPHIFDRYYQSNREDMPAEGGTGIGLALTQEYVKMMKGKIWVESVLEEGSTFYVEIPCKEILSAPEEEWPVSKTKLSVVEDSLSFQSGQAVSNKNQAAHSLSENGQLTTILVVEDNLSLRKYLGTILSAKYQVFTAENGQSALNQLRTLHEQGKSCQLILSDIMMPVMDGYQLLTALKADDNFCHIPVIMLTARADKRDQLKALRIGVDDYLVKPFEEDELLARIYRLLGNQEDRISFLQQQADGPLKNIVTEEDRLWLERFETYVLKHLSDDRLSVAFLVQEFAMSESTLLRQLKKLTGLSPSKYLKELRLGQARSLLENQVYNTVSQVAAHAGFKDTKYFARSFKNRFGKSPSAYLNK